LRLDVKGELLKTLQLDQTTL